MEEVRFGIIGIGNIGTTHTKNLLGGKVSNARLTAVCDINPQKTAAVKAMPGTKNVAVFSDYKEMLASGLIDAVIVSVPHYFHPQLAMDALKMGIHTVCEKPAGVYTKQVKEMNAVAQQSKAKFTMMFNQRTNCVYRKMREMILGGEIGEIKRMTWIITNWYRSQSYYNSSSWRATWEGEGGGVLLNQCPHNLDLLQWVMGMHPTKVHTHCHFGKWHDIEVEDDVSCYLEFPNGATGIFVTSTADAPGINRFEVLGTKGSLIVENDQLVFKKNEMDEREFNRTWTGGFGEPKYTTTIVKTDGKNPQHAGILSNFANAILGKEELFVDGTEGIWGVELMDAMLLSTWLDKEVSLPIDDDVYLEELNRRIASSKKKAVQDVVLNTEGTYGSQKA